MICPYIDAYELRLRGITLALPRTSVEHASRGPRRSGRQRVQASRACRLVTTGLPFRAVDGGTRPTPAQDRAPAARSTGDPWSLRAPASRRTSGVAAKSLLPTRRQLAVECSRPRRGPTRSGTARDVTRHLHPARHPDAERAAGGAGRQLRRRTRAHAQGGRRGRRSPERDCDRPDTDHLAGSV